MGAWTGGRGFMLQQLTADSRLANHPHSTCLPIRLHVKSTFSRCHGACSLLLVANTWRASTKASLAGLQASRAPGLPGCAGYARLGCIALVAKAREANCAIMYCCNQCQMHNELIQLALDKFQCPYKSMHVELTMMHNGWCVCMPSLSNHHVFLLDVLEQ